MDSSVDSQLSVVVHKIGFIRNSFSRNGLLPANYGKTKWNKQCLNIESSDKNCFTMNSALWQRILVFFFSFSLGRLFHCRSFSNVSVLFIVSRFFSFLPAKIPSFFYLRRFSLLSSNLLAVERQKCKRKLASIFIENKRKKKTIVRN